MVQTLRKALIESLYNKWSFSFKLESLIMGGGLSWLYFTAIAVRDINPFKHIEVIIILLYCVRGPKTCITTTKLRQNNLQKERYSYLSW